METLHSTISVHRTIWADNLGIGPVFPLNPTPSNDSETAPMVTQSEPSAGISALQRLYSLIGPIVVPIWGSYVEAYKVIPKRNYNGAYGQFIIFLLLSFMLLSLSAESS